MRARLFILVAILGASLGAFAMVVRADGSIHYATGGQVNYAAGGQINYDPPTGAITGYSTHPTSACGSNAAYYGSMKAAGVTVQRTDSQVYWASVEPSSGSFSWTNADCTVNDALTYGIQTVIIINGAPSWAGYNGCAGHSSNCPPKDAATLASFCTAIATHYDGTVKYYEIYNEPNGSTFSLDFINPMLTYTVDEIACYNAIKAVDPSIQVIAGSFEPAGTVASSSVSISSAITTFYANGGELDILGAHPYTYPEDLTTGNASSNAWQAMIFERQTMNANGDSAKPIWITEVGAPTCGPGNAFGLDQGGFTSNDYMTLAAQKQIFDLIIATSTSPFMNIGKIFGYTWTDANSNNFSTRENCFGVTFSSLGAKPVMADIRSKTQ